MKNMTPESLLNQFDRLPSEQLQSKLDYFFMPYNTNCDWSKHM